MEILYNIALVLVLIGALNWGSIGVNGFNFVHYINKTLVHKPSFDNIVYIVVGIAALLIISLHIYKFTTKNALYYKHYEFHWCNDGVVGDAHCIRAGYGNRCLNNTCIVDTTLPNAPNPF